MSSLFNKRILLGITGSIAAYKACELVRLLRDAGSDVKVVMTDSATEFVSPLTFQALSNNEVYRDLLDEKAEAGMGHISLARWADAIIVAPASADFIARLVTGRADNLLSAVCLATTAPLAIAPAMNQQMWLDSATQDNIQTLKQRNMSVFGPASGDQACGEVGPGRLLEPAQLLSHIGSMFLTQALSGVTVLITAGPTREPIDPVRYISNRSSGRMGFALAEAVIEAGGRCILVSGPVHLNTPEKVERIDVETTRQMADAVNASIESSDIFIGAAAVCDFRPTKVPEQKMKKQATDISVKLTPTGDILAGIAAIENKAGNKVFTVGFAAETHDVELHAKTKLLEKNLDMIVANDVSNRNIGFDSEENEVTVYWKDEQVSLTQAAKTRIARQLIEIIAKQYQQQQNKNNPPH